MDKLAQLDHQYVWHPFTQMKDWLASKPIVITDGKGAVLNDVHGREYLDANSSIWTNLHGHKHPKINAAIQAQLEKISHSSALGFANEPASLLAEKLVTAANAIYDFGLTIDESSDKSARQSPIVNRKSQKVFFSDDGSTAMEVALKLCYEVERRVHKTPEPKFLSLEGAYHGDTVGAVSLGHIDLFHKAYGGLLFKSDKVMAPYCYRCPYNRAEPERADAREYRKCNWECVGKVEETFVERQKAGSRYAGFIFEPLMQGAAGMIPQPDGWLNRVAEIARSYQTLLIADEVMTGFGRMGDRQDACPTLFASHKENVQPDFLCVAKGLTGGYLPMAATVTTQEVFDAFLGEYDEFKTFFHGHSFTGNQLGASAALASLEILHSAESISARAALEKILGEELKSLWALEQVGDIRQVGLVVGIELVKDWKTRGLHSLTK
jgi:adenosylmethionine-8-amino-7-oxononanoate aminotransferase